MLVLALVLAGVVAVVAGPVVEVTSPSGPEVEGAPLSVVVVVDSTTETLLSEPSFAHPARRIANATEAAIRHRFAMRKGCTTTT